MAVTNKDLYEALERQRKEYEAEFDKIEDKVNQTYVKLIEFSPVKKIVYGLVTMTLTTVFGAILALVVATAR